jgi:hypothetical protein
MKKATLTILALGAMVVFLAICWSLTPKPHPPPAAVEAVAEVIPEPEPDPIEQTLEFYSLGHLVIHHPRQSEETNARIVEGLREGAKILTADETVMKYLEYDCNAVILLHAQGHAESECYPKAVSPDGWDRGWSQINCKPFWSPKFRRMVTMAEVLEVKDVFDPRDSIPGQARFMKGLIRLMDKHYGAVKGRDEIVSLALAAYTCGPARTVKAGKVPDVGRTTGHVAKIMAEYTKHRR